MSDLRTVRETLLACARPGACAHAMPPLQTMEDALQYVVDQVDRIVLPRRIRVMLADGTSLNLDAQNRRLLRCGETPIQGSAGTDVGQELTPDDTERVTQFLGAKLAGRHIRNIQTTDDPAVPSATTPGISPFAILRHAGVEVNSAIEDGLETRLASFISKTSAQVVGAFVMLEENLTVIHGSADQLVDWAKVTFGFAGTDGQSATLILEPDEAVSIRWPGPTPRHAMIVRDLEEIGVVVIDGDEASIHLRHWIALSPGQNPPPVVG